MILKQKCDMLEQEPISAEDVLRGAKLLKGSIGVDWWEVDHLKSMPYEVAQSFAILLNCVEEKLAWPVQILLNLIVLMGKPNGGVRPIALMPMLYRLWSKIRRVDIHKWDNTHTQAHGMQPLGAHPHCDQQLLVPCLMKLPA